MRNRRAYGERSGVGPGLEGWARMLVFGTGIKGISSNDRTKGKMKMMRAIINANIYRVLTTRICLKAFLAPVKLLQQPSRASAVLIRPDL